MENPQEYSTRLCEWLKAARKERNIGGVELSEAAGITQASISRVETGSSAVTIPYLQKVLPALGLGFEDLITQGFIRARPDPASYFADSAPPPANLSEQVVSALIKMPLPAQTSLLFKHYSAFVHQLLSNFEGSSPFAFRQLFSLVPSLYIEHIPSDMLRSLVASTNAVMLPIDVGAYIYQARKATGLSLNKAAKLANLSVSGLRNIEFRQGGRLRLVDAVTLDSVLEEGGRLVSFAWLVHKRYSPLDEQLSRVGARPQVEIALETLITISRLWQIFFPNDDTWVERIRQDIIGEKPAQHSA